MVPRWSSSLGGRLAEHRKLGVYLPVDVPQLLPQSLYRQRLEHVADDVVLNRLFRVFKVVIAAEKGNVRCGTHLPHLPGQLNARDKRHSDIGEQQIRLVLFHQLEGIQPVAGAAHQAESQLPPGDHGTHRLPQLVLVVRSHHCVGRLGRHGISRPFPE